MKERFSLYSFSLKRRIWVAVSLVTIIPLIVLFHYFSGYDVSAATVFIVGIIVVLGWALIMEVIIAVIKIYSHTRDSLLSMGHPLPEVPNEIKNLDSIINLLSSKVKTSLEELKDFGEKTEELNREVSKKVVVLSSILQANELFSKNTSAEDIIDFLVNKIKDILKMKICVCAVNADKENKFRVISYEGVDLAAAEAALERNYKDIHGIKAVAATDYKKGAEALVKFGEELSVKNIALCPVFSSGKTAGIVIIGNSKDSFAFGEDDYNILNLFSQNIALVWEHKKLSLKVNELEILDYLTGFYNKKAILNRLDEEIKRAAVYQRPCGFLIMEIAEYELYREKMGTIESEILLKKTAGVFKETTRPIDILGRIAPGTLAAILIELNKRQCQQIVINLKEKFKGIFSDEDAVRYAVAENPLDGNNAAEIAAYAEAQLNSRRADETL